MLPNPGLYVHFPWCVKKCPYCDFNSHPLQEHHDFQRYTQALLTDLASQNPSVPFASVFFGGGTPSLFQADHFSTLIGKFQLAAGAEVTMEANPGTTEYTNFADYLSAGINRLSLGAQSFDDRSLVALGRIHCADEIRRAFSKARQGGFENINLDLMWGLPGQKAEDAERDLQQAIDLQPEHISWYQLTIEPKTEFAKRPPLLPVESEIAGIEQLGTELLAKHGYVRYEVSAYSKRDRQCQHNLNYWRFGDYMGIGAGAHGKISNTQIRRTQKPRQPRLFQQDPKHTIATAVDQQNVVFEFMLNTLRLVDGSSFAELEAQTGIPWQVCEGVWSKLLAQGLVRSDRAATTALGFRYLDSVVSEFLPNA